MKINITIATNSLGLSLCPLPKVLTCYASTESVNLLEPLASHHMVHTKYKFR